MYDNEKNKIQDTDAAVENGKGLGLLNEKILQIDMTCFSHLCHNIVRVISKKYNYLAKLLTKLNEFKEKVDQPPKFF